MTNLVKKYSTNNFEELLNYGLGWDRYFKDSLLFANSTYPPHNIAELQDGVYEIEIAVAGFSREDLAVEITKNNLVIKGAKKDVKETKKYHHQGLAARSFTKSFVLPQNVKVTRSSLEDGILRIELLYVVPEEEKPKQIQIL
jgi:molecular chaperone IbpA